MQKVPSKNNLFETSKNIKNLKKQGTPSSIIAAPKKRRENSLEFNTDIKVKREDVSWKAYYKQIKTN